MRGVHFPLQSSRRFITAAAHLPRIGVQISVSTRKKNKGGMPGLKPSADKVPVRSRIRSSRRPQRKKRKIDVGVNCLFCESFAGPRCSTIRQKWAKVQNR